MNAFTRNAILAIALACPAGMVQAQTPDNPSRKETTREREDPARAQEPADRNNPERIDPLLAAELEKCDGLDSTEHDRCVVSAKRKFGEI